MLQSTEETLGCIRCPVLKKIPKKELSCSETGSVCVCAGWFRTRGRSVVRTCIPEGHDHAVKVLVDVSSLSYVCGEMRYAAGRKAVVRRVRKIA